MSDTTSTKQVKWLLLISFIALMTLFPSQKDLLCTLPSPRIYKKQAKHYKLMLRNWQPLLARSTEQTPAVKPFISQKHHCYHPRKPFTYKMNLGTPPTIHSPERYIINHLSRVNFLSLRETVSHAVPWLGSLFLTWEGLQKRRCQSHKRGSQSSTQI